MHFDVVTLSRIQFALTVMFHYIFPPLSIGLGVILVIMEGLFLKTKDSQYEIMARFWTRIFAINFAIGVATGIVMEFEFGTNWSTYSRFVGDVFGSALAAEGVFAFFLESGFLSILVFGWDRVSPKMHFFSTVMVAMGSIFSAIWIVVANSWQQTPAGFHLVRHGTDVRAETVDFWAVVFNPSSVDRLEHVLIAAIILGAFFVMSVAAHYLLNERYVDFSRKSFRIGLYIGAVASMLALLTGHEQAKMVSVHQPAKLAAFEGHYRSSDVGTPLYVFGIPDSPNNVVRFGLPIKGLLSFLVFSDFTKPITALDRFEPKDRPPVGIVFQAYHFMVALGLYFIAITLYGIAAHQRGRLFTNRTLLRIFTFSVIGPFLANQLGWVAAEVGRQPWAVYGLLRTSEGVSTVISSNAVLGSIVMFGVIYAMLFAVWIFVLNDKIQHGPEAIEMPERTSAKDLIESASRLAGHAGHSMTDKELR